MQSWHNSLHAAVIMQAGHITAEPLAVTDAEGMPNAAERFEMFRYACEYLPEERLQDVCCRVLCPPLATSTAPVPWSGTGMTSSAWASTAGFR